ncbi:MAG: RNA methyltransferase [Candidatus Levybacteria bacterium CG10_big_fil_rev_8_21_14_0_10_36_7]|nr:MAG: RNA methyltransferase [Candidatus Levybacteria bacterium CG10_big_fil_rev_8_21_14_0_10_36_7]
MKLNAKELRESNPTPSDLEKIKKNNIYIILDNVLDTYNIGSIFRLADATGVKKIYLCGETETPPNSRIKKASVGTWQWVDFEHVSDASTAIKKLREKDKKIKIIAIEQNEKSIPYTGADYSMPLALIVGHETFGVSKDAISLSDTIVELPMLGVNISLNVMVSLGIVLYQALEHDGLS